MMTYWQYDIALVETRLNGTFQGLYTAFLLLPSGEAQSARRAMQFLGIFCNGADDALRRSKVAPINDALSSFTVTRQFVRLRTLRIDG